MVLLPRSLHQYLGKITMNFKYFYLLIGCITSFCFAGTLHYLHESTAIICTLIEKKQLSSILEDADPEGLSLLINNYSPAIIALESEALNCILPVIVYFYRTNDPNHQELTALFEQCAMPYDNHIKFIAVDVDKLPAIAEAFEVQLTPAISAIRQREEINFVETDITYATLQVLVEKLLPEC